MDRRVKRTTRGARARWGLALVPLVLVLAACSSGGGGTPPSADQSLKTADSKVRSAMNDYLASVSTCKSRSNPVVCLEAADLKLGNHIHTYANLLAVGHGFTAPKADLTTTRNAAQTLANSLEILGDAQPTQANYDQVLNTFNLNSAIGQLQHDVAKVSGNLRG